MFAIKKYYWISYQKFTARGLETFEQSIDMHPFAWRKEEPETFTLLLNWREISKGEYDFYIGAASQIILDNI